VGEIAGWTCGRQTGAAVSTDRDFRVAHASRVLVSASRRNKLLVKTRRSIAACCTDKSSRSRGRARQHARRVRYPERRARRSRSTYCTHSSNAAGSPHKCARTSPAKCSEPVINTGFGFARASVSASPTVGSDGVGEVRNKSGQNFCKLFGEAARSLRMLGRELSLQLARVLRRCRSKFFIGENCEDQRRFLIAKTSRHVWASTRTAAGL